MKTPTVMVLSRQSVPLIAESQADLVQKGAYVLKETHPGEKPELVTFKKILDYYIIRN